MVVASGTHVPRDPCSRADPPFLIYATGLSIPAESVKHFTVCVFVSCGVHVIGG